MTDGKTRFHHYRETACVAGCVMNFCESTCTEMHLLGRNVTNVPTTRKYMYIHEYIFICINVCDLLDFTWATDDDRRVIDERNLRSNECACWKRVFYTRNDHHTTPRPVGSTGSKRGGASKCPGPGCRLQYKNVLEFTKNQKSHKNACLVLRIILFLSTTHRAMKLCANEFRLLKFAVRSAKPLSRVSTAPVPVKDVKHPRPGVALTNRANHLASLRQPRLSPYDRNGIGVCTQSSLRTPMSGKVHSKPIRAKKSFLEHYKRKIPLYLDASNLISTILIVQAISSSCIGSFFIFFYFFLLIKHT